MSKAVFVNHELDDTFTGYDNTIHSQSGHERHQQEIPNRREESHQEESEGEQTTGKEENVDTVRWPMSEDDDQ